MGCSNCGAPRAGRAKRCGACNVYYYRHGVERPEELRIRTARRRLDRLLQARLLRLAELFDDASSIA